MKIFVNFLSKDILLGIISLCVVMTFSKPLFAKTYNVRSYGAKGDGKSDDLAAINRCIADAIKNTESEVFFPAGTYIISDHIDIFLVNKSLKITGVSSSESVIKAKSFHSILVVRGYFQSPSTGKVVISRLKLEAVSTIYSDTNSRINTPKYNYGILATDLSTVTIMDMIVSNVYGKGIYVNTTQSTADDANTRISNVDIKNCKVLNCWGFHPKMDDYGDGVYIGNVLKGTIAHNSIINDYNITKQLGRVGLVIEYNASNCTVSNNTISGYDRGIHVEDDLGGHVIRSNQLVGSDIGLVFFHNGKTPNRPVQIIGNYISNRGMPRGHTFQRTRGVNQEDDRSLLNLFAPNGAMSNTTIRDNILEIDGAYDYFTKAVVNLYSPNLILKNNRYKITNKEALDRVFSFNTFYINDINEELFEGVDEINIKDRNGLTKKAFEERNKINGAIIHLR